MRVEGVTPRAHTECTAMKVHIATHDGYVGVITKLPCLCACTHVQSASSVYVYTSDQLGILANQSGCTSSSSRLRLAE